MNRTRICYDCAKGGTLAPTELERWLRSLAYSTAEACDCCGRTTFSKTMKLTLDANHSRLAAMKDRRTADLFASGDQAEDLTLAGEVIPEAPTFAQRCERAAADVARSEPEQATLF